MLEGGSFFSRQVSAVSNGSRGDAVRAASRPSEEEQRPQLGPKLLIIKRF
jgi:hypothetical protein